MDDRTLIQLAGEAGFGANQRCTLLTKLKLLSVKIEAAEREACAKACEGEAVDASVSPEDAAYNAALKHAADAIRMRSNA